MARTIRDKYANLMSAKVVTNGAAFVNTEITTGVSLGEGKGMLVDQIDYFIDYQVVSDFIVAAAGDRLQVAIATQTDQLGYDNSKVIHEWDLIKYDDGTAAVSYIYEAPKVFQFFPPIIFASPKIYLTCYGSASIAGGTVNARVYYRYVDLSSQEYLELAEAFALIG